MAPEDEHNEEEQNEEQTETPETPPTGDAWETFLATLPADQQAAYKAHISGLTSALDKERRAAKSATKKVTEFEKKEKEAADAQLSELERTKKALLEAQEASRLATEHLATERAQSAIRLAAATMKFNDPNDAVTWIKTSELEWDEDKGKYTNLEAKLKALVTSKPYLVATETKTGGLPPRNGKGKTETKTETPTPTVTF